MRIVFIGAGELAIATARLLLKRGHEVIVIDRERERIDALSEDLDCAFIHGDGSRPDILREAAPEKSDLLFCLSQDDQINIIAGIVGKSLGFKRIVTMIGDPTYQDICLEVGLKDTIIPDRTIARYLADIVGGQDILELSTMIRGEVRFFSFTVDKKDAGRSIKDLELPDGARAIYYYRKDDFIFADPDDRLKEDDEVVILAHSRVISDLRDRWEPHAIEKGETGEEDGEE
jgi:trk system potassium uptake protein TrkA